ncbi:DUF3618 domain-containing protein [Paracoccaceae bacterium GXU_MW_L88]
MADKRSVAQIEADIEADRLALERNLAELQDRLSFGNLAQEAMGGAMGALGLTGGSRYRGGRGFGEQLLDSASDLFRSRRRRPHLSRRHGFYGTSEDVSRRFGDPDGLRDASYRVVGAARDRAQDMSDSARDFADETRRSARDYAQDKADRLRAKGHELGENVRSAARDAQDRAADLRDQIAKLASDTSEEAQRKLSDLREEVVRLEAEAEYLAARARDEVIEFYDERPLQSGIAAFAAGALFALMMGRR